MWQFASIHASQLSDEKRSAIQRTCDKIYRLLGGFVTVDTVYRFDQGLVKEKPKQFHTSSCKQCNLQVSTARDVFLNNTFQLFQY